jgi:hypothetical protein
MLAKRPIDLMLTAVDAPGGEQQTKASWRVADVAVEDTRSG